MIVGSRGHKGEFLVLGQCASAKPVPITQRQGRGLPWRPWFGMVAIGIYESSGMRGRQSRNAVILILALCAHGPDPAWAAGQRYQADEWVTECSPNPLAGAADCSMTIPFWQAQRDARGSFALVVMLQTGNIGIVGQPLPLRAVLRVDKNPPVECRQARYCVFPGTQALDVLKQLAVGSLVLIDVYTAKAVFRFSLTPKGFQAGLAQIRAWGYHTK
jgi:hypothetical protein